jgi:transglutaminase-like putative cysteine protease
MRGSDAHAWVQVYLGDGRWMWSDPTAGATLAEDRDGVASRLLALLRSHAVLLGALVLGAAAAAVTTLLAVRRLRSRRAAARALAAPLEVRVLAAFAALERALAGTPLARPPQASVLELRRLLLERWPGGLPDAERVSAALAVVQRVLYSGRPVVADDGLAALACLDRLTEAAVEARARGRQKVRTGRGA